MTSLDLYAKYGTYRSSMSLVSSDIGIKRALGSQVDVGFCHSQCERIRASVLRYLDPVRVYDLPPFLLLRMLVTDRGRAHGRLSLAEVLARGGLR